MKLNRLLFYLYTVFAFLFAWRCGVALRERSWTLFVWLPFLAGLVWLWFELRKEVRK